MKIMANFYGHYPYEIEENYFDNSVLCQGFVILGYIDGEQPVSKPRKPDRVLIIEDFI